MKVLIVTERFYPEEFIVNELAAGWAAGGESVDVLTQAPSYPFGRIFEGYSNKVFHSETWKGIGLFRFFTITGYRDSLSLKLLNYLSFAVSGTFFALFKARGYDRIFVYQTGPLTLAIPAVVAGWFYGIPVTIWTQDIWPDMVYAYGFKRSPFLSWLLGVIIRIVYRNCAAILVSCEGFSRRINEYVPGREIKHFPNWPTVLPDGSDAAEKLPGGMNFTFAGNVGKLQNLDNVIKGFALAVRESPDLRLNIVGDGSHLQALKDLVRAEDIPGVTFWGRRPSGDMPAFFRPSDVMVLALKNSPGLDMTVPAKFQAYLAFHKPMLCVANGEVKALAEKHGIGLWADPDRPESIRDAFLKFRSARELLPEFSRKARALLEAEYDRGRISVGILAAVAGGRK